MALKSDNLLKIALQYFPRWMDIRKKYFSSNGGKYLKTIADNTEEIQKEIDEYVKLFFISNYADKCEEIPDYIYRVNIGSIDWDTDTLTLINPDYQLTTSIKEFYENDYFAYYEDGFIYVKDEVDTITYLLNTQKLELNTERVNVWNVYDEFAAFINIKRYVNETNRELFNRIIATASCVINSSEDGLKNAIISSLTNIVPDIEKADITIEGPTPENLMEYYDDYNLVLDKLSEVNRDVLKEKRWDIDLWQTDFKKIDYIPSKWDVILDEYQNGIGDNDDLKFVSIEESDITDININAYEQSVEQIDSYLSHNKVPNTVTLNLMKYNNYIKPEKVQYKIKASEVMDITDNSITFDLYESVKERQNRRFIEDIISGLHNVKEIDNNLLEANKKYRVQFVPNDPLMEMEMYECYCVDTDSEGNTSRIELLKEQGQFAFDEGTLKNQYVKKAFSQPIDFDSYENIMSTADGLEVKDVSNGNYGVLSSSINGCENIKAYLKYSIKATPILTADEDIELTNYSYSDSIKGFVDNGDSASERQIHVEKHCNSIKFTAIKGDIAYSILVGNERIENSILPEGNTYTSYEYNMPQNFEVFITSSSPNQCTVSNIMYTKFDLDFSLANSNDNFSLSKESSDLFVGLLPDESENTFTLKFKSYTQNPLIIKRILIGTMLDSTNAYLTDLITAGENTRLFLSSNCNVNLYKSDNDFDETQLLSEDVTAIRNYYAEKTYQAYDDDAYIELNLSDYTLIDNISVQAGTYSKIEEGQSTKHYIMLSNQETLNYIDITGTRTALTKSFKLNDLITKIYPAFNPEIGDKLYISKLLNCIKLKNSDGKFTDIIISKEDLMNIKSNSDIELIKIENVSNQIMPVITIDDNSNQCISTSYYGNFKEITFYPKKSDIYICRNEYVIYTPIQSGIDIVNTFNNNYPENANMYYQIESEDIDKYNVMFDNNSQESIGEDTIKIILKDADSNINYTKNAITFEADLSSNVELEDSYITSNKEIIELNKYIIADNDNYTVNYDESMSDSNLKYDYITIDDSCISKLTYSNINEMFFVGSMPNIPLDECTQEDIAKNELSKDLYKVEKEKGIIVWDSSLIGDNLYVAYYIKKPISLKFNQEYLYTAIKKNIKAYAFIGSEKITGLYDGSIIKTDSESLSRLFQDNRIIYIECTAPGFIAEIIDGDILIKKAKNDYKFAIKTGWYYIQNREYYLFADTEPKNSTMTNGILFDNCIKDGNTIYTHKETKNYVKNSLMESNTMSSIYHIDDFKDQIKGISSAEHITACESYNFWNTFAMNISIKKGFNGNGLYFTPCEDIQEGAYGYINITKLLKTNAINTISFYKSKGLNVYIGYAIYDLKLNTDDIKYLIPITTEIQTNSNLYYGKIDTSIIKNAEFFIVATGQGMLDDLIISSDESIDLIESHTKNIDKFKITIAENTPKEYSIRFIMNDKNMTGYKADKCELNKQNYIINSGSIDWGLTLIKSISTRQEWLNSCTFNNISIIEYDDLSCAAASSDSIGTIVTMPIYVGESALIKSVRYKINNVELTDMTGFSCKMYEGNINSNQNMRECSMVYNNMSNYNYCNNFNGKYVQLKITVPKNKVINNIEVYIEYKEDVNSNYKLMQTIEQNGIFISKVLDANYQLDYTLKQISVDNSEGKNAVFFIRASREESNLTVWSDWKQIDLNNPSEIKFGNYRFFQIKVELMNPHNKVKINYVELGVDNDATI